MGKSLLVLVNSSKDCTALRFYGLELSRLALRSMLCDLVFASLVKEIGFKGVIHMFMCLRSGVYAAGSSRLEIGDWR